MNDSAPDLLELTAADDAFAADLLAPPTISHYEPGPETRRMLEWKGRLWEVTYYAERDHVGWLVKRATCRPVEANEAIADKGDRVWIAVTLALDCGPEVEVSIDGPSGVRRHRIHRSMIRHVETVTPAPLTVAKPPGS